MQKEPEQSAVAVSSRERLITVAKHLFAALGYESTTTAAIAREAHTSESQLVKHFRSKEGLLEAVFESGWKKLHGPMTDVRNIPSPRLQLKALSQLLLRLFGEDPELRDLMLLEGRRIRREGKAIMLTRSYTEYVALIDSAIEMAEIGKRSGVPVQLVRSFLVGMFEGVLRDLVLNVRSGSPSAYSVAQAESFMGTIVDRLFTD